MHSFLVGKSTKEANYNEKVLNGQGQIAKHMCRHRGKKLLTILRESGAGDKWSQITSQALICVLQSTKFFHEKSLLEPNLGNVAHYVSHLDIYNAFIMHILILNVLRSLMVKLFVK